MRRFLLGVACGVITAWIWPFVLDVLLTELPSGEGASEDEFEEMFLHRPRP